MEERYDRFWLKANMWFGYDCHIEKGSSTCMYKMGKDKTRNRNTEPECGSGMLKQG